MQFEPLPGDPAITLERNVSCRTRDGVTLAADVYRPSGPGPNPVLLMRDPYDKTGAQSGSGFAHPSWYARQGYVVVVQDCRGRFRSEGDFIPFVHEAADGYDAVEWAARLPGADGRVAMYGFSYPGATQLLAATVRPPSLVTICPGLTASQYHEGWTYEGGALSLAFAASWAAGLAFDYHRRRGETEDMAALERAGADAAWYATLPLESCRPITRENAPYYFDWLAHPSADDYWRQTSIAADYSRITVPAIHFGGWYDVFLAGTVENFVGLQRTVGRQKLVIGPWIHGPWVPTAGSGAGVEAAATVVDHWQVSWLGELLKGERNGVLDAPATVYVLGDGWRDLDGWPPSGAEPRDFFLHSGGLANSAFGDGTLSTDPPGDEPPDVFVYDPLFPQASSGGHSCCDDAVTPMGPASQRGRERWRGHPRLHDRPARARRRAGRRRGGHPLRGLERRRHRLHGEALHGRPGRRVDQPP